MFSTKSFSFMIDLIYRIILTSFVAIKFLLPDNHKYILFCVYKILSSRIPPTTIVNKYCYLVKCQTISTYQ